MSGSSYSLPPPRRVITGHDAQGKSMVIKDEPSKVVVLGPKVVRHDIHASKETPAKLDSEVTGAWKDESENLTSVFVEDGSGFHTFDFHPGSEAGLHRSITLDYAVVMKGSITLVLDSDLKVFLSAGDTVVQRATMHGWKNEGQETCRIAFVMLPAQGPVIQGKALEMDVPWLKKKDAQL